MDSVRELSCDDVGLIPLLLAADHPRLCREQSDYISHCLPHETSPCNSLTEPLKSPEGLNADVAFLLSPVRLPLCGVSWLVENEKLLSLKLGGGVCQVKADCVCGGTLLNSDKVE